MSDKTHPPIHPTQQAAMVHSIQATLQPYIKFMQANLDLLGSVAASPQQGASQSANGLLQWPQQNHELMTQLMQGWLKNYAEFVSESSQGSQALLTQSQQTMQDNVSKASHEVAETGHEAQQARMRQVRTAAG